MRQDDRAPFDRALHGARVAAYAPGEFVGQESFMTAGEIRALAVRAGIGPGVAVLDVCCGIAGPGRFLTRELGCDYLGVDASAGAVAIARERAGDLPCRFAVAEIPPLPAGSFDVVLLLETILAFADKDALAAAIGAALRPGGRFAFTLEEGAPLTAAERAAMPDADTVWLTPLDDMTAALERAGLAVTWQEDHSAAHRATAERAGGRVRRGRRGHRRADRPAGAGRPARRPPALDRVAGRGPGAEARAGRGAPLTVRVGALTAARLSPRAAGTVIAWRRHQRPRPARTASACGLRRARCRGSRSALVLTVGGLVVLDGMGEDVVVLAGFVVLFGACLRYTVLAVRDDPLRSLPVSRRGLIGWMSAESRAAGAAGPGSAPPPPARGRARCTTRRRRTGSSRRGLGTASPAPSRSSPDPGARGPRSAGPGSAPREPVDEPGRSAGEPVDRGVVRGAAVPQVGVAADLEHDRLDTVVEAVVAQRDVGAAERVFGAEPGPVDVA